MQISMHYHALYCLARASGLPKKTSTNIAYASAYVDKLTGTKRQEVKFKDGSIIYYPTCLKMFKGYYTQEKCWNSWVPFHFLPGNDDMGGGQSAIKRRLVCKKDSPLARKMMVHAVNAEPSIDQDYRIGVSLHVYADTFSHSGFSGLQSSLNNCAVNLLNINSKKYSKLEESKFAAPSPSQAGNKEELHSEGMLELTRMDCGHGSALTKPDVPYLEYEIHWKSKYRQNCEHRNNPSDFTEACLKMFQYLCKYSAKLSKKPLLTEQQVKEKCQKLVLEQEPRSARYTLWQKAFALGEFGVTGEKIPAISDMVIESNEVMSNSKKMLVDEFNKTRIGHFIKASEHHRRFVLCELLPEDIRDGYKPWNDAKNDTIALCDNPPIIYFSEKDEHMQPDLV